jgi:hypothetical protein
LFILEFISCIEVILPKVLRAPARIMIPSMVIVNPIDIFDVDVYGIDESKLI